MFCDYSASCETVIFKGAFSSRTFDSGFSNVRHAGLLGLVLVKLFLIDLTGIDTVARIVSFLGVCVFMLVIGYVTPLPPRARQESEG